MKSFKDKIAVISGGSSGMGREIAIQLAEEGCHLAICATSANKLAETKRLCEETGTGVRVTTHVVDVTDEAQILRFRDEVMAQHSTDHINLLINNAGIAGDSGYFTASREQWEKVYNISWDGVYFGTRAFMPLLQASDEGHIANMSSVAGFWGARGSYSVAKHAIKAFTEGLVYELPLHAPHIHASVIMPGKIKTDLIAESQKHLGNEVGEAAAKASQAFADSAPTTAPEAAKIILDGIRENKWRILVGIDAEQLDVLVRETPDETVLPDFPTRVAAWQ